MPTQNQNRTAHGARSNGNADEATEVVNNDKVFLQPNTSGHKDLTTANGNGGQHKSSPGIANVNEEWNDAAGCMENVDSKKVDGSIDAPCEPKNSRTYPTDPSMYGKYKYGSSEGDGAGDRNHETRANKTNTEVKRGTANRIRVISKRRINPRPVGRNHQPNG